MNEEGIVTISDAINSLVPTAKYCVTQNDIDQIDWQDDSVTQPSNAEIEAEVIRLQAVHDGKKWVRDRQYEYPSVEELTVALYDTDDKAAIETKRAAVKTKWPKDNSGPVE